MKVNMIFTAICIAVSAQAQALTQAEKTTICGLAGKTAWVIASAKLGGASKAELRSRFPSPDPNDAGEIWMSKQSARMLDFVYSESFDLTPDEFEISVRETCIAGNS